MSPCVVYALWCESEQVAHYACASRAFIEMWLPRYESGELGACGPHRIVECAEVVACADRPNE